MRRVNTRSFVCTALFLTCVSFIGAHTARADSTPLPVDANVNAAHYRNAAGGFAGIESDNAIHINVNNASVNTKHVEFTSPNQEIVFDTTSPDSNNTQIHIGYDLTKNQVYFTNNHYGNSYAFNGSVSAGDFVITNGSLFKNGLFAVDALAPDANSRNQRMFMDDGMDWGNIHPDTLIMGGFGDNQYVHVKATCANTSGGDEGGSCYQFTDMGGNQLTHRSGAGGLDGINIDARSSSNAPIDTIGGNVLVTNSDGTHSVKGNTVTLASDVAAGATSFTQSVAATNDTWIDCGSRNTCSITGVSMVDGSGNAVTVAKAHNDGATVTLDGGVSFKSALKAGTSLQMSILSADGVAYALAFPSTNVVEVYPKLSDLEAAFNRGRMTVFTNLANGMNQSENYDGTADMPNYYFGYWAGMKDDTTDDGRGLYIETTYYPGTSSTHAGFVTINSGPTAPSPSEKPVGQNSGDQYDWQVTYTGKDGKTYTNTNTHHYKQPALFLGLSNKNFNSYALQYWTNPRDGITRTFDNEWDFWMGPGHGGGVSSHGLTLTWGGTTQPLSKDSYMLNLAGFNIMPVGLMVNGVFPYGGKLITSDAGFGVFKNVTQGKPAQNTVQPIMNHGQGVLGQARGISFAPSTDINSGDTTIKVKGPLDDSMLRKRFNLNVYAANSATLKAMNNNSAGLYTTDVTYDAASNTTTISLPTGFTQSITAANAYFDITLSDNYGVISDYVSTDGTANSSMHLGFTVSSNDLEYLSDPSCQTADQQSLRCTQASQIIFDPNGVVGGMALGYGQGANTRLDLIDLPNGRISVTNGLEIGSDLNHANPALINYDGQTISVVRDMAGNLGYIRAQGVYMGAGATLNSGILDMLPTTSLRFETNSPDTNNLNVNMGFDLSNNRFYFSNNHYGDNYWFNGSVEATGNLQADGSVVIGGTSGSISSGSLSTVDYWDGTNKTLGIKFGSGLMEFSDKFHQETPLGNYTGFDSNGNPVITMSNDHSWLNYAASYNFNATDGSHIYALMNVSQDATTILNKVSAPVGEFDSIQPRTPGGSIAINATIKEGALAFANLPTSPAAGDHIFCTDCYSALRDQSYTKTGIEVRWNGSDWTDAVGNIALH